MSYNTKQKELIMNSIKKHRKAFTVKDIYEEVKEYTGLTTVYRMIDKLVEDDMLTKNITSDNVTYYQYLEKCSNENHFYLKCEKCGNMIHIDCNCIEKLTSHIFKKHQFIPSKDHIIINGICNSCKKKGSK